MEARSRAVALAERESNDDGPARHSPWRAALWRSGFRPFFLAGALYGPFALWIWMGGYLGVWRAPWVVREPWWHGHEMVFGFYAAIISGLLLTALPSWAGIREHAGRTLALLLVVWLAGRAVMLLASSLPWPIVAAIDSAALIALPGVLAPGLLRARQRKFAIVLPVLAALAAVNLLFHASHARGDGDAALRSLVAAVAIVVVLYSLVAGFMTPVFTNNALRDQRDARRVLRSTRIDVAAHVLAVAFALTQALAMPASIAAVVAATACVVHAARLALWRGWRVRGNPLVIAMHVGYAWLVVAFGLAALGALGAGIGARAWLHAVTIGAIGMMMLALMPRVALRHTGRALVLARAMSASYVAMSAAAVLRLAYGFGGATTLLVVAALAWSACFVTYAIVYGPILVRPSVPRASPPANPPFP